MARLLKYAGVPLTDCNKDCYIIISQINIILLKYYNISTQCNSAGY